MTCQDYERLIALYVEGDITDGRVETHLAGCAECRELLEDLRASQALLKELPGADPVLLGAVRSGVLSRIGGRRRVLWPWVAAAMTAAAVAIAVLHPVAQREVPGAPKSVVRAAVAAPIARAAPVQVVRRHRRPKLKRPAASKEPLVVKMLTNDPNIVIIWLVDQPGD